jgi:hypothetical protein
MAGCCGGKNAGKPISWPRYIAGVAFFTAYHSAVHAALLAASSVNRRYTHVRRFHGQYFRHLLRETVTRQGITLPGRPSD